MSTDRELLELAAKAAGIEVRLFNPKGVPIVAISGGGPESCLVEQWNPLADDGDALRLAVKLRISPIFRLIGCDATDSGKGMAYEKYGHDDLAATRRAIVRAAAEIGRAMP